MHQAFQARCPFPGAYWKGDERGQQLQRIYGTAFPTKKELDDYLTLLEEAKKRDHRRLGPELDLFSFAEELGGGLILWHPKGARIRAVIEQYWRERHWAGGYDILYTPHIGREVLWQTSGHLGFLQGQHVLADGHRRAELLPQADELPVPYPDLQVADAVLPGPAAALGGARAPSTATSGAASSTACSASAASPRTTPTSSALPSRSRTRSCGSWISRSASWPTSASPTTRSSFRSAIPRTRPSTPGATICGCQAEASLVKALEARGLAYERMEGEAVFYGPKIDIKVKDALGRFWQCTTIQFDFNMSERFDMTYHRRGRPGAPALHGPPGPAGLARAVLRDPDRALQRQLSRSGWPRSRSMILPIAERHDDYARKLEAAVQGRPACGPSADLRREKINYKIREAERQKVPLILVVGDKEVGRRDRLAPRPRPGRQGDGRRGRVS